jgi:hypothetical protein
MGRDEIALVLEQLRYRQTREHYRGNLQSSSKMGTLTTMPVKGLCGMGTETVGNGTLANVNKAGGIDPEPIEADTGQPRDGNRGPVAPPPARPMQSLGVTNKPLAGGALGTATLAGSGPPRKRLPAVTSFALFPEEIR